LDDTGSIVPDGSYDTPLICTLNEVFTKLHTGGVNGVNETVIFKLHPLGQVDTVVPL